MSNLDINNPYAAMLADLAASGYGITALSEKLGMGRRRVRQVAKEYGIKITERQRYPSVIRIEREFGKPLPDVLRDLKAQGLNRAEAARRLKVQTPTLSRWAREFDVVFKAKPRTNTVLVTWQGKTQPVAHWALDLGLPTNTLSRRIKKWKNGEMPLAVAMMAGPIPRALSRYNCAILQSVAKVPSGVDLAWLRDDLLKEWGLLPYQLRLQTRLATLVSHGYLWRMYTDDDKAVWRISEQGLKVVSE